MYYKIWMGNIIVLKLKFPSNSGGKSAVLLSGNRKNRYIGKKPLHTHSTDGRVWKCLYLSENLETCASVIGISVPTNLKAIWKFQIFRCAAGSCPLIPWKPCRSRRRLRDTPMGKISPFSAYVALSRSRGRNTIRLLGDFDEQLFKRHPNQDLAVEMERLTVREFSRKHSWKISM